ncbi:MAG TPA: hypothetical protein VF920_17305 [Dongiaceae bacterium]
MASHLTRVSTAIDTGWVPRGQAIGPAAQIAANTPSYTVEATAEDFGGEIGKSMQALGKSLDGVATVGQ